VTGSRPGPYEIIGAIGAGVTPPITIVLDWFRKPKEP
jgi:hypothetical protein